VNDARPILYWFRSDLRTADLPGLSAAVQSGRPVVPCYVLDDDGGGGRPLGSASRWWLHHSLESLGAELATIGLRLVLRRGDTARQLGSLVRETDASAVYCSRGLCATGASLEESLQTALGATGVDFKRYPGTVLLQPEQVATGDGSPYRVFTPFWRRCRELVPADPPLAAPARCVVSAPSVRSAALSDLDLLPQRPNWAAHWPELWSPGVPGAHRRLEAFLEDRAAIYRDGRNFPAAEATSRLSPHLRFGEISPRQVWWRVRRHQAEHPSTHDQLDKFLSELGWREFSYHLLFHFPHIVSEPFRDNFRAFPWRDDPQALELWQQGRTGYPIVDAGMRELWHTGYMHNRVRMVVASFLCKHLLLPWQEGEAWFHDTLVDADPANNACGWQWAAGSGADAAPYFRIFNPTLQGQKFDTKGIYVRRWVPELKHVPQKHIHQPEPAQPDLLLDEAPYPPPMVDHKTARQRALEAYDTIKLSR
jgi:deoxyribodipyrimidine photo-lyase